MTDEEAKAAAEAKAKADAEAKSKEGDASGIKANEALMKETKAAKTALKETQAQLLELQAKAQKLEAVAKLFTADPDKADAEKIAAQRTADEAKRVADARAKEERTQKVREAVLLDLATSGRKLAPKAVRLIAEGAITSQDITISEAGGVEGIEAYLKDVFESFGVVEGGGKSPAPRLPRPGDLSTIDATARFAKIETFKQLVDMGSTARAEFQRLYPDRYTLLEARMRQENRSPRLRAPMVGAART